MNSLLQDAFRFHALDDRVSASDCYERVIQNGGEDAVLALRWLATLKAVEGDSESAVQFFEKIPPLRIKSLEAFSDFAKAKFSTASLPDFVSWGRSVLSALDIREPGFIFLLILGELRLRCESFLDKDLWGALDSDQQRYLFFLQNQPQAQSDWASFVRFCRELASQDVSNLIEFLVDCYTVWPPRKRALSADMANQLWSIDNPDLRTIFLLLTLGPKALAEYAGGLQEGALDNWVVAQVAASSLLDSGDYQLVRRLLDGFADPGAHDLQNLADGLSALRSGDLASLTEVLKNRPTDWEARESWVLLTGAMHSERGDFGKALEIYSRFITNHRSDAAVSARGLIRLKLGHWPDGWRDYQVRKRFAWDDECFTFVNKTPASDLKERESLTVLAEQGVGEQCLFFKYACAATLSGTEILYVVDDRLSELLSVCSEQFPRLTISSRSKWKRDLGECQDRSSPDHGDFFTALRCDANIVVSGDLPFVFKGVLDLDPRECLLEAEAGIARSLGRSEEFLQRRVELKERYSLQDHFLGISFMTKNSKVHKGQVPIDSLRSIPGKWVNLSPYDDEHDLKGVLDLTELNKFSDLWSLFALISLSGFVAGISNSTLHFSGLLGIPSLIYAPSPKSSFWYWGTGQSPYYPSVKITHSPEDFKRKAFEVISQRSS